MRWIIVPGGNIIVQSHRCGVLAKHIFSSRFKLRNGNFNAGQFRQYDHDFHNLKQFYFVASFVITIRR
jgi:hypothetical protein